MKNTLNVENLKSHLIVEDKATIEGAAAEGLQLIESDPQDAADAINTNKKEIYDKFNPIICASTKPLASLLTKDALN